LATPNSYGRNATSDYQHVLGIPWQGRLSFPEFAHKESLVWSERQSRGARKEISAKEAERECSTSWRTRSFWTWFGRTQRS